MSHKSKSIARVFIAVIEFAMLCFNLKKNGNEVSEICICISFLISIVLSQKQQNVWRNLIHIQQSLFESIGKTLKKQ